jgi:tetratricopeptide (TPR) repeat protein
VGPLLRASLWAKGLGVSLNLGFWPFGDGLFVNTSNTTTPQVMQKAMAHHRQHELQEALNLYAEIIAAEPRNFDALYLAGVLLVQDQHFEHALPLLDRALAVRSNHHELHYNRANALHGLKRLKEALQGYSRTIELRPDFALAYLGQSNVLSDLGAFEQALQSIDSAIKLMPGYAMLFFNRGNILDNLGQNDEALRCFDRAVALDPQYFQAWHNRGNMLALRNRFKEAQGSFKEAIRLKPEHPDAHVNLANSFATLGDLGSAMAAFEDTVRLFPQHADAHHAFSHCLLQAGAFERGWAEYAWRWKASTAQMRTPLASSKPRWTPNLKPQRLLIWAEQGVGDEVFWVNQLQAAAALAPELTVQTDPRLLNLSRRALPGIRFESSKEVLDEASYDAHLPMGDLGQALQLTAEKVKAASTRLLQANPERSQKFKKTLCPPGFKLCGVSWKSANPQIGDKKSLRLTDLLPVLQQPGMVFVNLQYGDVSQEIEALQAEHGITIVQLADVDNRNDLEGLADLIEACDIVLTTSSTTAHLAGALHKTTVNLVSRGAARSWYWRNEVEGCSLWYPTVRLFGHQADETDWASTVQRAAQHMARGLP